MARAESGVALLVKATPACRSPQQAPVADDRPAISRHWVEDERLRAAMKRIGTAAWPGNVPQDPESSQSKSDRDAAFRETARLARLLAESATHIPDAANLSGMSEADRNGFLNYATTLRTQAARLENAAHHRQVEPMQQSLDSIRATCISCHSRFRDFSGELAPPRA
ncbi:MAG: cytochrome c [Planctomycetes bacterium]|nr:cytochrome c [Planctomycetota bacterium]